MPGRVLVVKVQVSECEEVALLVALLAALSLHGGQGSETQSAAPRNTRRAAQRTRLAAGPHLLDIPAPGPEALRVRKIRHGQLRRLYHRVILRLQLLKIARFTALRLCPKHGIGGPGLGRRRGV